ncbi:MAG: Gamma-DL-glutamyl hydrolase [Firmicutes bacterium]|nr:Gamma-DL-glutamyl hydrolase [candidate division NPL-UPA2 bacterium]MBT9154023.1 Gamma-DL-glutamyl hydrolase [candidate division NPL-UPA2 bacterium]
MPPRPDTATLILATAEEYLGTPYVFGADGPESFDCSGFTRFVFAQHDIAIPRTSISQASAGVRVAIAGRRKGDILVFVDTWRPGISHVGIYMGEGQFIHATTREGVSYANLSSTYWGTRLHSVRRVIP